MAHIEKFTQAQTVQMLNHDERKFIPKKDDKHIDHTMSECNYNLAPQHDPWQFVKEKIAMSKKSGGRVNSRTVSCVSCVVTLPKGFKGDVGLFFETAKKCLDEHFGAHNVISAWVHMDESQPHLHYKVVPIVFDKETGKHTFNAKKLVTRAFLKQLHPRLSKAMQSAFGYDVGIENGHTKKGNLTVPQLREQQKDFEQLVDEFNALVDEFNDLVDEVESLKAQRDELIKKVNDYTKRLYAQEFSNSVLDDDLEH